MPNSNEAHTPMQITCKLSKHGFDIFNDTHLYKYIVGALKYVTHTRSGIAFNVNKVYQFMADFKTSL